MKETEKSEKEVKKRKIKITIVAKDTEKQMFPFYV